MSFGNLGFKPRFMIVSALILLGFGMVLAVGWSTLDRVKINGALYDQVVQDKDVIANILPPPKYIIEPYLLVCRIATMPDDRILWIGQLEESIAEYRASSEHWRERLPEGELRTALLETSAQPASEFFRVVEDEFLPAVKELDFTGVEALQIVKTKLDPLFRQHRQAILQAVKIAEANISRHEHDAAEAVERGVFWTIATVVVALGTVTLLTILIMTTVLKSMRTIIDRMRDMAMADADLSARLEIDSADEVGQLAKWINAFVEKIGGLVAAVKKSSIQLTSTATEMTATSREQEATINSFGASTNQIAAAVKEISATSAELMKTMQEVNAVARDSASTATSGRAGLANMESTMSGLADSNASISSKLAVINEKANEINVVVTTITKVADQTNLLSVNAAIEAEKAGEYGRGFLVVAREIRRLADQTATATLDIEETVSQMQSAVSAGVMEMDKFTDQVRRSVATMTDVSDKLSRIIEQVEQMTHRFEVVTDGMASQNEGAAQINDAMGSLSDGVQQTVGSLGEFTSAAEDLKRSVDSLKGEISKFKLEE